MSQVKPAAEATNFAAKIQVLQAPPGPQGQRDVDILISITRDGSRFCRFACEYIGAPVKSGDVDSQAFVTDVLGRVAASVVALGHQPVPTGDGFVVTGLGLGDVCAFEQIAVLAGQRLCLLGEFHAKGKGCKHPGQIAHKVADIWK